MRDMTRDEWWAFASEGTRTEKAAVVRRDGSPHVTPIWFLLDAGRDGDELIFTTWHESVKARVLRREPRMSVIVDDQVPPYSYVQFTAVATLLDDPGAGTPVGHRDRRPLHGSGPGRGVRQAQRRARRVPGPREDHQGRRARRDLRLISASRAAPRPADWAG